jgi:phytanoyl-CoA hydroxylase
LEIVEKSQGALHRIPELDGRDVEIPISIADDYSYFFAEEESAIRTYYDENGYAVVRNLLPAELCDEVQASFEAEVKPFRGFIYRQTTARPERHVFTDQGFLLNSILNIQSVDRRRFGRFRDAGLALMTHPTMQRHVATVLGEPGKLVQSMYFEGNPKTPPHQDTYYLDAEEIGRMTGAWIALENIAPGAGRFFVYPKSHLIDMPRNGKNFDIAFHHERYKELIEKVVHDHGLICRAPALNKGDVVFFSAKIIHGSMQTTDPAHSRRSVTAHFIPNNSRFLQFQSRIKRLDLQPVNGMAVHHPKDLAKVRHRATFFVETRFPEAFRLTKKVAIKLLIH